MNQREVEERLARLERKVNELARFTGVQNSPGLVRLGQNTQVAGDLTADSIAIANWVWTPYTPSVTAASGTLTTVSATGRYLVIGKVCFVQMVITITNNGTGAGGIVATIPFNNISLAVIAGRERAVTGKMLQGYIDINRAVIYTYDNTHPGANGHVLVMSGFYEIA